MKIKSCIKRIISTVLFLSLLGGTINCVSNVLKDKSSNAIYDTYKKICNDVDVEFLGASRVIWQIYPLNLWEDYGITAYNTAVSGSRPQCWYWIMRETMKYHKPELIVLDVSLLSRNEQANSESMVNQVFDAFPLDLTKIKGALDFKEENIADNNYEATNIFFNIRKYHDRWTNLTKSDFLPVYNTDFNTVRPQDIGSLKFDFSTIDKDVVTDQYTISMYYVEECVKLAQENNVDILLIQTPSPLSEESQKIYNWCYILAEKYGINYWNMSEDISYLNMITDKSVNEYVGEKEDFTCGIDENGIHLNVSGANKLTDQMGRYLVENYGIKDHRDDSGYEYFDECLDSWNANKILELNNQKKFDNYLMLLADEHYEVCIKVNNDMELSDLEKSLFQNIGVDPNKIHAGSLIFESGMGEYIEYLDCNSSFCNDVFLYDSEKSIIHYKTYEYNLGIQEEQEELPNIQFFVVYNSGDYNVNYAEF